MEGGARLGRLAVEPYAFRNDYKETPGNAARCAQTHPSKTLAMSSDVATAEASRLLGRGTLRATSAPHIRGAANRFDNPRNVRGPAGRQCPSIEG